MLKLKSNTLATWYEKLTHWKKFWYWERLKSGGEGDDRGWDGCMASLTRWTWVWESSWSWWRTRKCSVLQSMGSQRFRHDWATELDWTKLNLISSGKSLLTPETWLKQVEKIGILRCEIVKRSPECSSHYLRICAGRRDLGLIAQGSIL